MSSILAGSHDLVIQNPHFQANTGNTSYTTVYQTGGTRGFNILKQNVAPNAFYDSDDRPDPPKCHENTRVAVIKKIMDWVVGGEGEEAFMLWLYGPAGAGKTAIARTVAEISANRQLLFSSFLFFRSSSRRNTTKSFVANIAYRMTLTVPHSKSLIEDVIEADPLLFDYSLEVQLRRLVFEPLQRLYMFDPNGGSQQPFPPLIVVDGLDECQDESAQSMLIELLSSLRRRYTVPLKIPSRPEQYIKIAFNSIDAPSVVSFLELNDGFHPDDDIRLFLADKFRTIRTFHPLRNLIPPSWPSEGQLDELIRKTSGQFIYAGVVARFVNSACNLPTECLDIVLGLQPPARDLPFAELDTLYNSILSRVADLPLVLNMLGIIIAAQQARHSGQYLDILIEYILGLKAGTVMVQLGDLQSLVNSGSGDVFPSKIAFYHSSFPDFLVSKPRSGHFHIDILMMHVKILEWGVQLPPEPQRDSVAWIILNINRHLSAALPLYADHLCPYLWNFPLDTYLDHCLRVGGILHSMQLMHFSALTGPEWYTLRLRYTATIRENFRCRIDRCPNPQRFYFIGTVWFMIWHKFPLSWTSQQLRLWGTNQLWEMMTRVFGLDSSDLQWDSENLKLLRHPMLLLSSLPHYDFSAGALDTILHWIGGSSDSLPEYVASGRLAEIALACLRYLRRSPTWPVHDFLRECAKRSARRPWLHRLRKRRMFGRLPLTAWDARHTLLTLPGHPRCLDFDYRFMSDWGRTMQKEKEEEEEKEEVYSLYQYSVVLNLLTLVLRITNVSQELTDALSKPLILHPASLMFPRRTKRMKQMIKKYLKKASRFSASEDSWESSSDSSSGETDYVSCSE
ncbi:unnamed protein product [Cyclocybe aegerita]|uniref:Nephrocystin 3-like N-terminal domain-containing protein n=1 Tax=Cyclocybe aegerita TaxID=1973307 RepID=A0A8S0VTS7_CYCAE|nr:unnamed protein product [Cyclocybe aegerita]